MEISDDGERVLQPFRLAVWEGSEFSLHSHLYGGESIDLINVFGQFAIGEEPDGLTFLPKDTGRTPFINGPRLLKAIPQFGLTDTVQLTKSVAAGVPRHEGTPARGGELFVGNKGQEDMYLVLVSDAAVTYIMPDAGVEEQELVGHALELDVRWKA